MTKPKLPNFDRGKHPASLLAHKFNRTYGCLNMMKSQVNLMLYDLPDLTPKTKAELYNLLHQVDKTFTHLKTNYEISKDILKCQLETQTNLQSTIES